MSPRLPQEDPPEAVREAAFALLCRREQTRRELARNLRRKGYLREHVETVLQRLEAAGLLSDERYARLFVSDKLTVNPLGRRRLVQGLRRKGISAETAARAVEEVFGEREVDERELADGLARKRAATLVDLEPAAVRRRLAGYLARRGFAADVVSDVVRRVLGSAGADAETHMSESA